MDAASAQESTDPVTVVWSRRAKPGRDRALEGLVDRIAREMKRSGGYQGAAIMRPEAGHPQIFSIVAHFSSQADLDNWTTSELRGRLVAEADEVSVGGLNVQQAAGLEAWFQLPGQPIVVPPPRYKMAVVTWLAIFPLLIGANLAAPALLGSLPPIVRVVPVSMVLIVVMTWAVMPLMTKWFRFWLYASARRPPT
jgi:hypothetical protein